MEPSQHRWLLGAKPPGGQETGPNPTDRGKLGSKRHIVVDARGIPLVILISGANRHDSMVFEKCMDAIPAITGLPGRARTRPAKLHADKGYDYKRCRAYFRRRGIARRGVESSEKLGKHRWVVERTHGWFAGFGKLRIRFERRLDCPVSSDRSRPKQTLSRRWPVILRATAMGRLLADANDR